MPDRQSYSTRARKYISDFLEDRGENTASAADIINYLRVKGISVDPRDTRLPLPQQAVLGAAGA